MEFQSEIILENEYVRLSPLQKSDFNLLLPFSINEPELWEFSLLPGNGEENLSKYLELALEGRKNAHSYPFIVFDKRKNQIAGSTRFYDFQPVHNTVQLGYTWYGAEFQKTGLNRNCKLLMLTYAFETLKLDRVEFRADANNIKSIEAMKAIGCTPEGILRSNCSSPTGRRDSIVLSILANEWPAVKQQLIQKIRI
jgi:N-acetyltransferase